VDDDAAFAAIKVEYADVLGRAQPGLPLELGMELVIETGDAPMPQSRPVKRLLEGELAELRTQLVDLLNRFGSCSRACCVGSVRVEARWDWHICYDFLGLNAISQPALLMRVIN
jgi:hypothetical protein